METQENNILIAQFMGFDFSRFENDGIMEPQEEIFFTDSKTFSVDELKFNTDWNWLMEVVENIESLGFEVQIYKSTCMIYKVGNSLSIGKDADTKIEAVYNACVEFIKWYNEQK